MVGYIQAYHFCYMEIADTFIPTAGTVGILPMVIYFLMQVALFGFFGVFIAALALPQTVFSETVSTSNRLSLVLTAISVAVAGLVYYQLQTHYQHILSEMETVTNPNDRQVFSREAYNAIGQYRYVGWFVTMPIALVQAFLLLKLDLNSLQRPLVGLVVAILFMFFASYIGHHQLSFDNEVLVGYKLTWGLIAMIDYVFIGFTLNRFWKGLSETKTVNYQAFLRITRGLLITWAIYLLGYFLTLIPFDFNWLHLIFTLVDIVSIIGVAVVVYVVGIDRWNTR